MKKWKKIIAVGMVFVIVAGAAGGYFMYQKGPINVAEKKGVAVTATELYTAFASDSVKAGKLYSGKILEVFGTIHALGKNNKQQTIVSLKTLNDGAFVNCTFEALADIPKVDQVTTIKGICIGMGAGDADLGIMGDVYLIRCYTVTTNQ